ncbi:MAG: hypothetical protein C4589_07565 [Peptococcaceae bacterium]|nr:MAG: hypothetical protein C4589_07565 [Peptococcaceae bacterium]
MAHIHVYQSDGTTQISEGSGTNPIQFTLNATNNEEGTPVKFSVKCETGKQITSAGVTITIINNSSSGRELKWALVPDNAGSPGAFNAYGASLTLSGVIDATTGKAFWVKAKAVSGEGPENDANVDLKVEGTVEAV